MNRHHLIRTLLIPSLILSTFSACNDKDVVASSQSAQHKNKAKQLIENRDSEGLEKFLQEFEGSAVDITLQEEALKNFKEELDRAQAKLSAKKDQTEVEADGDLLQILIGGAVGFAASYSSPWTHKAYVNYMVKRAEKAVASEAQAAGSSVVAKLQAHLQNPESRFFKQTWRAAEAQLPTFRVMMQRQLAVKLAVLEAKLVGPNNVLAHGAEALMTGTPSRFTGTILTPSRQLVGLDGRPLTSALPEILGPDGKPFSRALWVPDTSLILPAPKKILLPPSAQVPPYQMGSFADILDQASPEELQRTINERTARIAALQKEMVARQMPVVENKVIAKYMEKNGERLAKRVADARLRSRKVGAVIIGAAVVAGVAYMYDGFIKISLDDSEINSLRTAVQDAEKNLKTAQETHDALIQETLKSAEENGIDVRAINVDNPALHNFLEEVKTYSEAI